MYQLLHSFLALSECAADIVFLVDASSSVGDTHFGQQMDFIHTIATQVDYDNGGIRFGVSTFSSAAHVHFNLNATSDLTSLQRELRAIPYLFGSTNTAEGIRKVRTEMFTEALGDRPKIPNILILLTDGLSNINSERTISEAKLARQENIYILTVGIGLGSETYEIDDIATPPKELNRFLVPDFKHLASLSAPLSNHLCTGRLHDC